MNEQRELNTLHSDTLLKFADEKSFKELLEVAAAICNTPTALIILIDEEMQSFTYGNKDYTVFNLFKFWSFYLQI